MEVVDWVAGEEVEPRNDTWAKLSDGTYAYSTSLHAASLRLRRGPARQRPDKPGPLDRRQPDRADCRPRMTLTVKAVQVRAGIRPGQRGWDTPARCLPGVASRREGHDGWHHSGRPGSARGMRADYKVDNVRWVQYFTDDGAAIHENYWRRPWPPSGCPVATAASGCCPAGRCLVLGLLRDGRHAARHPQLIHVSSRR